MILIIFPFFFVKLKLKVATLKYAAPIRNVWIRTAASPNVCAYPDSAPRHPHYPDASRTSCNFASPDLVALTPIVL